MSNALVGNGYCDDEMNIAECNFDGGDCCGQCETITITLQNSAQAAQGSKEGIYHNSSMVNGKPSWTSSSHAIWYHQQWNDWAISPLNDIGSSNAEIYTDDGNKCPFNLPSEMWFYRVDGTRVDNSWTSAGVGEINVTCLNGNFS